MKQPVKLPGGRTIDLARCVALLPVADRVTILAQCPQRVIELLIVQLVGFLDPLYCFLP